MGKIFRVVRFIGLALATVGAARRGWHAYQDMKASKERRDMRPTGIEPAA